MKQCLGSLRALINVIHCHREHDENKNEIQLIVLHHLFEAVVGDAVLNELVVIKP